MNIKKLLVGTIASSTIFAAMATPVLASTSGNGSDYGTQPGFTQAQSQTVCSGAGAFDAFGKGANLGIAFAPGNGNPEHATFLGSYPGPGTDGTQTGINNSTLCGNPQN